MMDLYAGGQRDAAYKDRVNVAYWFKELMLTYKFGEKFRFEKALSVLRPYLCDELISFFEQIYEDSLWTNPITGKRGF